MKFPMLAILIYYIIGILTGITFQDDLISISLFSVAVFISIVMLVNYYKWSTLYFLLFFYSLGILLISYWIKPYVTVDNKEVELTGVVTNVKETNNNTKVYLQILNSDEKIYFVDTNNDIVISDLIVVQGTLKNLYNNNKIFEYNEFLYESSKNISYKIQPNEVKIIGRTKNTKYYLYKFRSIISNNYDTIFMPNHSSIVKAVVLGDRDDLDYSFTKYFKVGGIYHILAISGLHISLLTSVIYTILYYFLKHRANVITIIFLVTYGIFTGLSISTTRAIIMCSVFLMANILSRRSHPLNSLYVSAFVLLLYQPLYIFQAGFLLSYSAVIGILVFSPILVNIINRILYNFHKPRIIQLHRVISPYILPIISAFLFTTPVLYLFFKEFYPYTIFVNIIVGFTVPIFVFLSFLVGLVSIISLEIAGFIGVSVSVLIEFYLLLCKFVYNLPYSTIVVSNLSFVGVAFYYFILFIIIKYKKISNIFFKIF